MKEIIQYFNEVCINELSQVSENLYKNPSQFAEYIDELKKTVNKLGVEFVKETLEIIDESIKNHAKRKMNWHIEKSNCHKDLITTLGTVSFNKILYVSKEKNEEEKHDMCYLLDKVMGFEENQRLTEDAMVKMYEGVKPESPGSKRNKLIGTRYFCSGSDETNREFWKRVRRYIESVYETESIKKIYLNLDGGSWIKEGMVL